MLMKSLIQCPLGVKFDFCLHECELNWWLPSNRMLWKWHRVIFKARSWKTLWLLPQSSELSILRAARCRDGWTLDKSQKFWVVRKWGLLPRSLRRRKLLPAAMWSAPSWKRLTQPPSSLQTTAALTSGRRLVRDPGPERPHWAAPELPTHRNCEVINTRHFTMLGLGKTHDATIIDTASQMRRVRGRTPPLPPANTVGQKHSKTYRFE